MVSRDEILVAILMMSGVVYLTRAGGYFFGLQVRHIGWVRPILETLPGCAMMAIILPALRQGSVVEIVGLLAAAGLMWKTSNVAIATLVGLGVLVVGAEYI